VLEANAAEIRGILAELVEVKAPGTADPVGWLADKVRSMVDAFSLPADLKGFASPREGIPDLAQKASGASMKGNPRELSQEERMRIISRVV
jgi:alcohol dehydrogenase class IV